MNKVFLIVFISFSTEVFSQYPLLLDSVMSKAFSPDGYSNTKIRFKNFYNNDLNNRVYTEDSLKNKITFINFWFEGCAPCVAEFDALNSLYDKYRSNQYFQFISFTFESKENALRIAEKYNLKYPILCLKKEIIYQLIFNLGFPTNIITDKIGEIRLIRCGGSPEKEKATLEIDSLFSKEIEYLINF